MTKRLTAEFIGTFWLVLGGCGSAVLAAAFPNLGIGFLGVALAFGLTVLTMAFAIGHISGCHLNPAVSVGLWVGRRFPGKEVVPYVIAQVIGGIVAGAILYVIASGKAGFDPAAVSPQTATESTLPEGTLWLACLVSEIVMTMMFLFVIMGATDKRAPQGFAPIAIGLCLTLIHLISIPVTNTSVNPARSTGVALFAGGWALSQLWLFWVAPIIGGILGGSYFVPWSEGKNKQRVVIVPAFNRSGPPCQRKGGHMKMLLPYRVYGILLSRHLVCRLSTRPISSATSRRACPSYPSGGGLPRRQGRRLWPR